eukprot:819613_1
MHGADLSTVSCAPQKLPPSQSNPFTWRISSLSPFQTNILCCGYLRRFATTFVKDGCINQMNNEVIQTCTDYLGQELELLHNLKHAKTGQGFLSPAFTLNGLTFIMELYPNGRRSNPSMSLRVYVLPFIDIEGQDTNLSATLTFATNQGISANHVISETFPAHLPQHDIQSRLDVWVLPFNIKDIQKATNISISFQMRSMHKNTTYHCFSIKPVTNSHQWNIDRQDLLIAHQQRTSHVLYQTPIVCVHALKWGITFDFERGVITLQLASFPMNIRMVLTHCSLIVSTDAPDSETYLLSKCMFFSDQKTSTCCLNVQWKPFKTAQPFKCRLTITLLNVYSDVMDDAISQNKTPYELQPGRYKWRIPFLNDISIKYLCCGYLKAMAFPSYVPTCLIDLCQWFVDDAPVLDEIKKGRADAFQSNVFCIDGLKYRMRLYSKKNGRLNWYFSLVSMSPKLSRVSVFFRISLDEEHIVSTQTAHFDRLGGWKGWKHIFILNKEIQSLQSFTFDLQTVVINVWDSDKTMVTDYSKYLSTATDSSYDVVDDYQWQITDTQTLDAIKNAANSIGFFGPFFEINGFKYILEFYPNGESLDDTDDSTLYLTVASLPPHVSCIVIEYTLSCEETGARFSRISKLDAKHSSKGWTSGTLKNKEVQQLNSLTFKCVISLVDVYDINGIPTTKEWIDTHRHKPCICKTPAVGEYDWNISKSMMHQMKSAANCKGYQSEIFMMNGWQWMLEMFPNGNCIDCAGNVNVFLHLVSIPKELNTVYFQSEILVEACDTQYQLMDMLNHKDTSTGWPDGKLMTNRIKRLDEMVVKLRITIIDVFGADEETCCDEVREYKSLANICEIDCNQYGWRIDDADVMNKIKCAQNGERFVSNVFDINQLSWFITLYPNGQTQEDVGKVRVCVHLTQLPKRIACVTFYFEIWIVETNTRYSNFCHFINDYLCKGWRGCYLTFDQLKSLETITIQLKLALMDVYDENGKSALSKFIS